MLCYLSYQSFKDFFSPKTLNLESKDIETKSLWKYFFTGTWLVISAPTALIWFVTVGGSVVEATIGDIKGQSIMPFSLGFVTVSIFWSIVISYVSSIGGKLIGTKMIRYFSLASGILFVYFIGYIFVNGLKKILI